MKLFQEAYSRLIRPRLFIISQPDETRMPQMPIGRPLREFDLRNEPRIEPLALFHLLASDLAPTVSVGSPADSQTGSDSSQLSSIVLAAQWRIESVSDLGNVAQLSGIVTAHNQRIERIA
jgi:hypothetical protein